MGNVVAISKEQTEYPIKEVRIINWSGRVGVSVQHAFAGSANVDMVHIGAYAYDKADMIEFAKALIEMCEQ